MCHFLAWNIISLFLFTKCSCSIYHRVISNDICFWTVIQQRMKKYIKILRVTPLFDQNKIKINCRLSHRYIPINSNSSIHHVGNTTKLMDLITTYAALITILIMEVYFKRHFLLSMSKQLYNTPSDYTFFVSTWMGYFY